MSKPSKLRFRAKKPSVEGESDQVVSDSLPNKPLQFRTRRPNVGNRSKTYLDVADVSFDLRENLGMILRDHLGNEQVESLDPKTHELEFRVADYRFGGKRFDAFVPVLIFNRLMHHYYGKLNEYTESLSLDVIYDSNFRATITGENMANSRNLIRFFCSTNKLRNPEFMEKQQIRNTDNPDWFFRLTSSSENPIKNQSKILQLTKQMEDRTVSKFYRYKNRYSFKLSDKIRLDLTVVKEARQEAGTVSASGTLDKRNKEKYQVELEYLGGDFRPDSLRDELYDHLAELLRVYQNSFLPISKSYNDLVIMRYLEFSTGLERISREDLRIFSTSKFLAMEVEALTRENFDRIFDTKGPYMVTEKADGEHFLMYVDSEYGVFLINNRLEASPVFLKEKIKDKMSGRSIFDGELIEHQGRRRFLIFDCFFFEGKDLRDLSLYSYDSGKKKYIVDRESRFYYAKAFAGRFVNELMSNELAIEVKEYMSLDGMRKYFDSDRDYRFKESEYRFNIDGLIFMPVNESYPKVTYAGGKFSKIGSLDDLRISPILKWKPPEYMSVDFRVQLDHQEEIDGQIYQVLLLESAYQRKVHAFEPSAYRVKGYNHAYIKLTDGLPKIVRRPGYHVEEDSVNHIIKRNDVIEFIWIPDRSLGSDFWGRWFPIRYRDDKTQIGFPNNYRKVADRTWLAIQDRQITGKMLLRIAPSPQLNMGYYRTQRGDREKLMLKLRDVHNSIKSVLIHLAVRSASAKSDHLLDLATGRGGDLGKWIGIKYVFGVEFDEANLKAGTSSAYARYRDKIDRWYQMDRPPFLRMDLIQGNMGQLMESDNFSNEAVYNYLLKQRLRNPGKFGVVSCQFAIHYICDTEEHIDNFFRNVSRNLASNGYFVATTFDGEQIFRALKNASDETSEGLPRLTGKDSNDNMMWQITPVRSLGKSLDRYGQKIRVLNRTIKDEPEIEYLVNFEYLIEVAKRHDLYPAHLWYERSTLPLDGSYGVGSFSELYGSDFNQLVKDVRIYDQRMLSRFETSVERMPKDEKIFSKFNSYLILRKQS